MIKCYFGFAVAFGVSIASSGTFAFAGESVLYNFPYGSSVYAQIQQDSAGNIYGTTYAGKRYGTVYQLKEKRGVWKGRTIYAFGSGSDARNPYGSLTSARSSDTLYGTTESGGLYGYGALFSLIPSGNQWTENVLYSFDDYDGAQPSTRMTRNKATGALYGTTNQGGANNCGTAFDFDTTNSQLHVLYNFQGGSDGCAPETEMRQGTKPGTLFGATAIGGSENDGTLYLLTEKGGSWTESVLYTFTGGNSGAIPVDLTDQADNATKSLYGVAEEGGLYGQGVVFELSKGRGTWSYKVIYGFTGGNDGSTPMGLQLDQQTGSLYGTTAFGGRYGRGVVFKLASFGSSWSETVLHSFSGSDGANPQSRPAIDAQTGALYGTTLNGGRYNGGTVYSVTP